MHKETSSTSLKQYPPTQRIPLVLLPIGALLVFLFLFFSFPCTAHAAKNYELEPGSRTDVSTYTRATNLYLNKSGEYTLTGSSSRVMVYVGKNGGNITLKLDNLTLEPNNSAPGAIGISRSAITVHDVEGARVAILVPEWTRSLLRGWNRAPALCKTGLKTALTFDGGGRLSAIADETAFRTAGIGSAESESLGADIAFGNVTFNRIKVFASGSGTSPGAWYARGGPGIGASNNGYVDGIVFNEGCEIYAAAGAADAAGIGTSSGDWSWNPLVVYILSSTENPSDIDYPCKNLTINGGTIEVSYISDKKSAGGAGIGGGAHCSVSNLVINGGHVSVLGNGDSANYNNMWFTGIGAGQEADANNITITGGTIKADGMKTGIGGGYSQESVYDSGVSGDCYVYIEGGTVEASSSQGVGIGGYAGNLPLVRKSGKGVISISGGDITATGGSSGCGIGAGRYGYLSAVNISGGKVVAKTRANNTGSEKFFAIGACQGSPNYGKVRQVNITGGTVVALNENDQIDRIASDEVYIQGGSVYANAENVHAYKDGPEVARNDISLHTAGQPVDWSRNSLMSMTFTPLGYDYGTKDIIPFKTLKESWRDADFYIWLPKDADASVQSATLNRSIMVSREDEFTGKAGLSTGDKYLYPPIEARLYEDQTGTGTPKKSKIKYLTSGTRMSNPPTKSGQMLNGFSIKTTGSDKAMEADGTFLHIPGYTTTDSPYTWNKFNAELYDKGVDFYGLWKETEYTIRFLGNKPDTASTALQESMPDQKLKYTGNVVLDNKYALPGYDFAGWNTHADGTGTYYALGDTLSPEAAQPHLESDTLTLYAQWKPKTYTVTFEPGDGVMGTPYTQTMSFDQTEVLTPIRFAAPANRAFAGWQRKVGGGITVTGGQRYTDDARVSNLCNTPTPGSATDPLQGYTLEAQWEDTKNFTVVLLHNDDFKKLDNEKDLALKAADGTTYTPFTWDLAKKHYSCAETVVPPGDYTLTIKGVDEEGITVNLVNDDVLTLRYYSVEIDADPNTEADAWIGIAGTTQKEYVRADSRIAIDASTTAGHRFIEYTATGVQPTWQDDDSALPAQEVTIHGQVLITAHADAVNYKLRFHPNADTASGTMPDQDMRYGEPQALSENKFARRGYKMTGWATQKDGVRIYDPGQSVSDLTDKDGAVVDLYAVWQPITYTLHFEANDSAARGSMDDVSCTYDKEVRLPASGFAIPGYTLLCWNTEPDNTGHAYRDGISCQNLTGQDGETVTLYAQWAYIGFGPWLLSQPKDITVTEGATATFSVKAHGMDPLTYQWQRESESGWQDIVSATGSMLTLSCVTMADNGAKFRVRVTNGDGEIAYSATVTLTVKGTASEESPETTPEITPKPSPETTPEAQSKTVPYTGDATKLGLSLFLLMLSVLSFNFLLNKKQG